ncbi:antitoxin [Actinokineospora sp. G85]|uniref:antitoxin n=1 Tax=Actinokineospora sp. G85 TaxID=3406626 RepID=UPI003C782EB2
MKLSVSLPEEDVRFLDEYSAHADTASRSAVIHQAIGLLRESTLRDAYAAAFDEWETGDGPAWEPVSADGLADAPR